ncbi:MAG: S1C family serine protease [Acidothermaceae bacterium]
MSRRKPSRFLLVAVAASAVLVAGCTSSGKATKAASSQSDLQKGDMASPMASGSTGNGTGPGLAVQLENAYGQVVRQVLPSVVEITTTEGLGSGVVFDSSGDIVTNDHVVGSATSFKVRLATGATPLDATLVGAYPPDDLAVIKVGNASGLHPAKFADSSKARVGDIVLAMGNPLGLSSSVTDGIISATGRTVTEPQNGTSPGATLSNAIQTSAAINPGNSGGALVDLAGQVVGIPTLAAVDQQLGGGAAPGIGFAIPSNVVKDIAAQLVAHGKVVNSHRAALGVEVVTVTDATGNPGGVGIEKVEPGSAAEAAGITAGEIITAVNGTPTPDTAALSVVLVQLKPGDKAKVSLTKPDGSKADVSVTLGELQAG